MDGLDTLSTKIGDLVLIKTIEQGATTSVWLASGAYQKKDSGDGDDDDDIKIRTNAQYYEDCKPKSLDTFAMNEKAAQRLWKESEERAGITFDLAQSDEIDEIAAVEETPDVVNSEKEQEEGGDEDFFTEDDTEEED